MAFILNLPNDYAFQTDINIKCCMNYELRQITFDNMCLCIIKDNFLLQKLESQLRDVAYGTKQYKIMPPADSMVYSFPILCTLV